MRLLSVDPGSEKSGWCVLEDGVPVEWGWDYNVFIFQQLIQDAFWNHNTLLIEDVSHMGMAVGRDVFETVRWSGRFDYDQTAIFIDRKQVKLTLCGSPNAKDPNIRQAIIDRFGGDAKAIGGKKCKACSGKGWRGRGRPECTECAGSGWDAPPGPLHGITGHVWSSLAVALTWMEQNDVG